MVIRLFFVQCVLYTNVLHVISLSFIVLLELVKHILVAGVVRKKLNSMLKFPISAFRRLYSQCAVADDAVVPIRAESSSVIVVVRFWCFVFFVGGTV